MTATADPTDAAPKKKRSKLPLLIGFVLAILGGAGGFLAVRMGLILGPDAPEMVEEEVILRALKRLRALLPREERLLAAAPRLS